MHLMYTWSSSYKKSVGIAPLTILAKIVVPPGREARALAISSAMVALTERPLGAAFGSVN